MTAITPEQLAASGTEHGNQAAIYCWASMNLATYPELKWLFSIPNGGFRDKITAAKMKAEGVKRGVQDMCLPIRRGEFAALWMELKKVEDKAKDQKKNAHRTRQEEWKEHMQSQGHGSIVVYGWEEARDMLIAYLNYGAENGQQAIKKNQDSSGLYEHG